MVSFCIWVNVLPTYNTIDMVYMATYVMNWYSMPEVLSVTRNYILALHGGAMTVKLCQDDNRVCI